jgi:hypothetical protein
MALAMRSRTLTSLPQTNHTLGGSAQAVVRVRAITTKTIGRATVTSLLVLRANHAVANNDAQCMARSISFRGKTLAFNSDLGITT